MSTEKKNSAVGTRARKLRFIAKEKEGVRKELAETARQLATTAKEKEGVRKELAETARQLATTAKEKEVVRRELLEHAKKLERSRLATLNVLEDLNAEKDKLAEAKAKDEAMLASIGEGLVATDPEGRITLVNKMFEDILGLKADEVRGKLLTEAITATDNQGKVLPTSERPIQVVLKERATAVSVNDINYLRKDGTPFPVSMTVSPVLAGNEFVGSVEVFHDVTNEKAIEKAKTDFVSLASHQLRTPLTAISWYTELLMSGKAGELNEKQKEYLDEVYIGNGRMVVLVDALLNVSRFELGTNIVQEEPTDIVSVAQDEIDEQKALIDAKKIQLEYTFDKDIPRFQADPKLIHIVVQNLLSNAVKYTPEGGTIEVAISMRKDDNPQAVLLRVSDTGFGIPKAQQKDIFTKFFRADNVRAKDTEGTGLGLSITRSIVENAGGKIWFESEENKGTTFFVTLPLAGKETK